MVLVLGPFPLIVSSTSLFRLCLFAYETKDRGKKNKIKREINRFNYVKKRIFYWHGKMDESKISDLETKYNKCRKLKFI